VKSCGPVLCFVCKLNILIRKGTQHKQLSNDLQKHSCINAACPLYHYNKHYNVYICRLIKRLFEGTPGDSLPAACRTVNLKFRASDKPAIQVNYFFLFIYEYFYVSIMSCVLYILIKLSC